MNRVALAGLLVLAGVQAPVLVATPSGAAEEGWIPVIGETIDVRVVNVEVVATSGGQPVRGLTVADFRLLVDGREVPIEFFTEVVNGVSAGAAAPGADGPAAPVPPAAEVGRSYLVVVDESFAVGRPRDVVLENLEEELALLGPADRMAVLAFDGEEIVVLSPWTSDRGALASALRAARQREARGNKALAQHRGLERDESWMNVMAADEVIEPDEALAAMEQMSKRVSPEARTQLGRTAVAMAASLRGFEPPPGRRVMLLLSGGWSLGVAPRLYGPVITAANQLGYTLYPVDVASPTPQTLKMLDAVAAGTGGRVANSVRQDVFRQVVADSGSYYWLGFTPSWQANDRHHSIAVVARREGVQVRARNGFPDLSRKTENLRKAEGVLLFGGHREDRRLRIELGGATPVGRREIEVPVTLGVPVAALALTPSGRGYVAEAPLAVASLDEDGGRADIPMAKLRVAVKELPGSGGYARFQTTLRLRRAPQRLVFTVRDEVTGATLWQEVELDLGKIAP